MTPTSCLQCNRVLGQDESAHLHVTRFFDIDSTVFWTAFPTTGMLEELAAWLRETRKTQLIWESLPFLPPGVYDYERLAQATEKLRGALGLPHVRSLLDLLDALNVRLSGAGERGPAL